MEVAGEDEINLESLKMLKQIFEAADEDGSGELDIDEFCAKLGPHLGVNLKRQQVAQLFMKIDADAGGTVDWDEFTNYMFLEKVQASAGEGAADNWRLFPADFRDKNEASCYHHEQVDKLYFCGAIDKYISCGRDGSFRLWNAADLKHVRTVSNGGSWITDCLYLPHSRKMVFTTMDRAITYYDINRGSYDLIGCVYASGTMGVPLALHLLSGDAGERVVYGDTSGSTVLLLCGSRELPARDLISTEHHKDYLYLHKEHSDWVTKVQWIPEVGLVTSSLDATIKTFDINRERITHTCTHHTKGVHSFAWCKAYSCFASCGLERDVTVWHGTTGRKIGELHGHISSVTQIALDEHLNHVFTLSIDKTIKVWDLRNHKCLQTISEDDWSRHDDSQPSCLMYDGSRRRLVTAQHRPYVWQHKVITQDRTGHREPIRGALYNSTFAVVVSVDEGGAVCVWNLQDGARAGRFSGTHDSTRVTAISFDKKQRRLVTAGNDGSIKLWNFNNGSLLRRFSHDQEPLEVCEVLFVRDAKKGSDAVYAAGWNAKVFVWEDRDEDEVQDYKAFEGHAEDILAMASYPARQLLATGDYQGRIQIWGLFSGEKKSWMAHRAERYETSVERLLWLPAFSPTQRQAAQEAAAALTAAAASLATGGSCSSTSSFFASAAGQQQQQGMLNGGASGVPLMIVPSQFSVMSQLSLAELPGAGHNGVTNAHDEKLNLGQQQRQQQQQQQHASKAAAAMAASMGGGGGSGHNQGCCNDGQSSTHNDSGESNNNNDSGQVDEPDEHEEDPEALLLLSAGGDGLVRVWTINSLAQGQLLCTLPGAQGLLDVVTAMGLDGEARLLVIGDSSGHLRVFDISQGIDTSSSSSASASFRQAAHWQAHDGAIASVDVVPARTLGGTSCSGGTAAAAAAVASASGNGSSSSSNTGDNGIRGSSVSGADIGSATTGGSSGGSTGGSTGCGGGGGQCVSRGVVPPLIVAGSRDANVSVWTLDGGLLGLLGEHSWDLDNPKTWQDPAGKHKRPPKPQEEGLFLKPTGSQLEHDLQEVAAAAAAAAGNSVLGFSSGGGSSCGVATICGSSVASHGSTEAASGKKQKVSFSRAGRSRSSQGVASAAAVGSSGSSSTSGNGRGSGNRDQQGRYGGSGGMLLSASEAAQQQQQPQQQPDLGGLSMATLVIQDHKARARSCLVAPPEQPHCRLAVHQLQDVDGPAGEILRAAADKRRAKQQGRHLQGSASNNSQWSSWSGGTASGGLLGHFSNSRPPGFNWRQQQQH